MGRHLEKLLVALPRINVPGDELLAQGAATIAGPLQELRGGVAADLKAALEKLLYKLQRLEICPTHGLIRGAVVAVGFENLMNSSCD